MGKSLLKTFNSGIAKKYGKTSANVYITTKSRFSDENALVEEMLKQKLDSVPNFPCKKIDPSTIKTDPVDLKKYQKAFFLARKYRKESPRLNELWRAHKNKFMYWEKCDEVFEIVKQLKKAATEKV